MPYYLPWLTDAILLPFYRTCRCPEKKKKTCNETTGTKLGIENKFYLKKTNYILHICRSLGVKNSKDKSETKRMKQANSHPLIQWFTNLCCGHRHLFLSMGGNLTPSSFQEGGSPPPLIETSACGWGKKKKSIDIGYFIYETYLSLLNTIYESLFSMNGKYEMWTVGKSLYFKADDIYTTRLFVEVNIKKLKTNHKSFLRENWFEMSVSFSSFLMFTIIKTILSTFFYCF